MFLFLIFSAKFLDIFRENKIKYVMPFFLASQVRVGYLDLRMFRYLYWKTRLKY